MRCRRSHHACTRRIVAPAVKHVLRAQRRRDPTPPWPRRGWHIVAVIGTIDVGGGRDALHLDIHREPFMTTIRTVLTTAALCLAFLVAGDALADDKAAPAAPASTTAEKAAPAKSPVLKAGDSVYVCGCGESCHCKPGI